MSAARISVTKYTDCEELLEYVNGLEYVTEDDYAMIIHQNINDEIEEEETWFYEGIPIEEAFERAKQNHTDYENVIRESTGFEPHDVRDNHLDVLLGEVCLIHSLMKEVVEGETNDITHQMLKKEMNWS